MKRKRISILIMLLILAIAFSAAVFAACNDPSSPSDTEEIEATEGLLISNSDFKVIGTSGSYPRTVTDWSGGKIYSSSSVPGDVIAGAISLEEALYSADRELWNDDGSDKDGKSLYDRLIAGGHFSDADDAVNNVLMIHMPTEDMAEDEDDDYGPTAYGYTSKSFSLEAGSYYKLSVDVLTYDIAGTDDEDNVPGARIYISSNGYAEISGIDTEGEWKTYTVYIESAATSSTSLTVNLGLGKYSSYYRDGLTTGYAFFDNVELVKINDGETTLEQAKAEYDEAVSAEKTSYEEIVRAYLDETATADEDAVVKSLAARYSAMDTRTMTLLASNGRFDFGSTTVGTSAPSGWTLVTGDDAPTSYRFNGVINTSVFEQNISSYAGTYYLGTADDRIVWTPSGELTGAVGAMDAHVSDSIGDSAYMLSQQMMTAQGIRSSRKIVIEKNGFYALRVSVLTYNVYGGGVSLILSGDGEDIVIEGISENPYNGTVLFGSQPEDANDPSNDGWRTYTFYIRGNQFKDMSYNLTLWLGTGDAEDNTEEEYTYYSSSSSSSTGSTRTTYLANGTFASGWAFFDDVALTRYADKGAFDAAKGDAEEGFELDASVFENTALYTDLSSDSHFAAPSEEYGGIAGDFRTDSAEFEFAGDTLGKPAGWTRKVATGDDADSAPIVSADTLTAGTVDLTDEGYFEALGLSVPGVPYDLVAEDGMTIRAEENTAFAMRSGDITVKANRAYSVSVWVKTDGVSEDSGAYLYLKKLDDNGKETTLSSFSAIDTAEVETYNGWSEYTFYIKGSDEGKTTVWLEFALGSGTRWAASTLTSGAAYFANLSMLDITYSDYSSASAGTYVQKTDLSTGSVDGSFANGSFGNIDYDELSEAVTASESDGTLQESGVTGVPEDWTLSDQTITEKEDGSKNENFVGGVIKLDEDAPGVWGASTQVQKLFPSDVDLFNDIYSSSEPEEAKGAPYLLALAGLGGEKYSVGYLSDKFTLDASTNYSLSVWAKAQPGTTGMIFLKGEASGSVVSGEENDTAYFTVEGDGYWHRYTFNIEVGLTDVSLQLGLWLGENTSVTGSSEDAKDSGGIILFDSVTLHEGLTAQEIEDYLPARFVSAAYPDNTYEEVKRISFYTDSFDALDGSSSETDEDGDNVLTSPNGWTGTRGTDQDAANTTSGVFNTSNPTTDGIGGISYVTGLGPELDVDDFDATQEEIAAKLEEIGGSIDNDTDVERAREAVKQDKYDAAVAARLLPADALPEGFVDGNNVLVINNTLDSAYRYGSADYTLTAETAYKITVRVFTYGIGHVGEDNVWTAAEDRGAYIELYLGSSEPDDNPLHFYDINTGDGYATYTMYVLAPSEDVTDVSLRLGLGRYDADDETQLVSGYAFFDSVTIEVIGDETDFGDQKEDGETSVSYSVPEDAEQGATGDDEDSTEVPSGGFDLNSLWWMIPTIVIALAIIAVVIVFFVKKYRKKFTKKAPEEPADSVSSSNVRKKKDDYDAFNE